MAGASEGLGKRAAGAFKFSDPYRIYTRRALRLAITFPAALVVESVVLDLPQVSVLYGLFGCFSLTTICDFGGPYRSRALAYAATICVGWVSITIASAASFSLWAAVGATLVYAFLVTYSGVLRGYFAAAVPGVLVGFFVAISSPHDWSHLGPNLLGWTVGAGFGAGGALLLWPMRTRNLLRRSIADVFDSLAVAIEATWVGGRAGGWERSQRQLATALVAMHANYTGLLRRPGSGTGRQRYLRDVVLAANDLAATLARTRPEKISDLPGDRELAWTCANTLRDCASVYRARRARNVKRFPDMERLNQIREGQLSRMGAWLIGAVGSEPALRAVFRVRRDMILRRVSGLTMMAAADVHRSSGRDPHYQGMGTFSGRQLSVRLPQTTARRTLLLNLTPDSIWFRNSVRAAVAFSMAVAVILLTGLDHGFWIALGVMVALQPDSTGSRSSVVKVLVGTVLGVIIGVGALWLAQDDPAMMWALLVVSVALATFAPGASTPIAGQTAFTIFLLILFALLIPGEDRATAGARLVDVALAMMVTLLADVALWPRGAAALAPKSLAEATLATGRYVVVAFRRLSAGSAGSIADELAESDQAARFAYERADENIDLASAQRVPERVAAEVWLRAGNAIVEALLEVDKVKFMADALDVGEMFPKAAAVMEASARRISAAWVESICASCGVEVADYIPHYEPVRTPLHGMTVELNVAAAQALESLVTPEHPRLSEDEAAKSIALIASVAALSVLEFSAAQLADFAKVRGAGAASSN